MVKKRSKLTASKLKTSTSISVTIRVCKQGTVISGVVVIGKGCQSELPRRKPSIWQTAFVTRKKKQRDKYVLK